MDVVRLNVAEEDIPEEVLVVHVELASFRALEAADEQSAAE